jgi:TPP-dependent indolepyruvate ferredoxin oxidoreductase alpha subunit
MWRPIRFSPFPTRESTAAWASSIPPIRAPGVHRNEQDNRHLARAAKVPMIEPSDPAEAKDFTKLAFRMSEEFDVPVIVRITTRLAHSQGLVELEERKEYRCVISSAGPKNM